MYKILDHGYVKYIEHWGSDERVIEAARQSTSGAFKGWGPIDDGDCKACWGVGHWHLDDAPQECPVCAGLGRKTKPGDEKLLRYLWEHDHSSCFEMAGLVLEVQVPLVVERQWQRHRTLQWFSINELSGRYTTLPEETYIPSRERLANGGQSKSNKQASGVGLPTETVDRALTAYNRAFDTSWECYQELLTLGVARELARGVLTVHQYTRMRISGSLLNWTKFLSKRLPSDVQVETRSYAEAVGSIVAERFPRTWALFEEGRK